MKEKIKPWLEVVLEAGIIIIILYFICFPFRVNGESMENALNDEDIVFASRVMAYLDKCDNGDLIVFEKETTNGGLKMVKRVIASSGDEVLIKDGLVYINGEVEENETIVGKTAGDIEIILDENEFFVLGDNRENSKDSRSFGVVKKEEVVGKVIFRLLPINDFKIY